MKKFLPILFFIGIVFASLFTVVPRTYAQVPTPDVAFTPDSEVNFVGKAAARSIQFLNWTLQNYNWACVTRDAQGYCNNSDNPLTGFWATIRNIVYAFLALFVLITAFVLISTRGKSLTIQRFLPRFVAVILLVTFSYAILQLIYITGDLIQGFFLTKPGGTLISAKDLLFVGWDYETFIGLRKVHPYFDESVFVNLLLARMTAVTYYAMTGILLIRKIILWFFIVVSPVFPVLLLYYPIRNTAKIWIGEFFRWLLYAPLFSIFLAGLVTLWKANAGNTNQGIPLVFDWTMRNRGDPGIVYPTATNILLGGPGQTVTIGNNLNTPDTFAQYVVALIMLWVVILLPFVLLQIFLDYLNSFSLQESPAFQKIVNSGYSILNKNSTPILPPGGGGGPPPGDTGIARQLPWAKYGAAQKIPDIRETGEARQLPIAMPLPQAAGVAISPAVLASANLSMPTMRDIAVYERAMMTKGAPTSQTVTALQNLANPQSITNPIEREKFNQLKEKLVQQSQSGNVVAGAVISAVNLVNNVYNISNVNTNNKVANLKNALTQIANPASVPAISRDSITKLHDSLVKESEKGNTLASTLLSTTKETSMSQVQDLREQLVRESMNNNSMATNVLATAMSSVETSTLNQVMKEATSATQNNQMHDMLVRESEKGNTLATEILNNKETTSTTQLEQFKEKLVEASLQGNQVATQMLASAISKTDIKNSQQVLTQIANPASVPTTVTRERFTQLKEKLVQAQQKGDSLAGEILSTATDMTKTDVKEDVKTQEVQKLKDKLIDAKAKGNSLAGEVLASMSTQTSSATPLDANLPTSNRIQTVSLEDYEAVKKMWSENYKNMDVPEGLDNRKSWVDAEVKDIDGILALLESGDQSKVQEGMQQVSNILPFLMLGGFSQEEIVAYLKAKREAGKSVLETIVSEESEEDTMVSVEKRHRTATMTQAQSISIDEDTSEISHISAPVSAPPVSIKVSDELLKLTNLSMPSMRDVVKFETSLLSKDATNFKEVTQVKETLTQLGNPSVIASPEERARVEEIKNTLVQNSQQGDVLATSILNAANHIVNKAVTTASETNVVQQMLEQLAQPELITSVSDRERVTEIKQELVKAGEQGNQIATSILQTLQEMQQTQFTTFQHSITNISHPDTITNQTEKERYMQFKESLVAQKEKGNQVAATLLSLPETVTSEDLQKVHKQVMEAKAAGDPVADDVLNLEKSLLPADKLQQVKDKLNDAKEKGDPLAAPLLSLISQQGELEKQASAALPETNRIQTVSVEDYEAIRQMWTDNYKNLEVPNGVDRKAWITEEGESIDQIVTLLSSNDPKQVEEGMQQVSNILPFLLLGGFSQQEIVAYLKAKREAGKEVIKEIEKDQSSEDTMITVENHTAGSATMTQAMTVDEPSDSLSSSSAADVSVAVNVDIPAASEEPQKSRATDTGESVPTVPVDATLKTTPDEKQDVPSDKPQSEAAKLTGIAVPTISDLVKYDLMHKQQDNAVVTEIEKLRKMLRGIAMPDTLTDDEERKRVLEIRKALSERQKGDAFAAAILEAAAEVAGTRNAPIIPAELLEKLREYIKEVLASDSPQQTVSSETKKLADLLERESQRGNQLARSVLLLTKDTTLPEVERLKEELMQGCQDGDEVGSAVTGALVLLNDAAGLQAGLTALNDPRNAPQLYDKEKLTSLKAQITKESDSGNQFAKSVLAAITDIKPETVSTLKDQLIEQAEEGNSLAGKVLSIALSAVDKEKLQSQLWEIQHPSAGKPVNNTEYTFIHEEAEKNNALAQAIIAMSPNPDDDQLRVLWKQIFDAGKKDNPVAKHVTERIHEIGEETQTSQPQLTDDNRVQTVSLQDYENVKKLWEENYTKVDLPSGETDRKEWLRKEIAAIEETVSLLGSTDQQNIMKGMERVSSLLPFLLLGGFSRQEVLSYVQAKLQAAKNVFETQNTDESVQVEKKSVKQKAALTMEVPAEESKSSDSQKT